MKKIFKNWSKKKKIIISVILVIAIVAVSVVGYFAQKNYLFDVRYITEESTNLTDTNTNALYDLEKLNTYLDSYLPTEDDYEVTDENSYIIPGLLATKTLKDGQVDMCTSMTPQGVTVTENYVFISAYCHTHKHNSVIYMLDKNTHQYIKTIVVNGQYHLGNICYDSVHKNIWCAATGINPASGKTCAYLNTLSLETIESYDFNSENKPLYFNKRYPIPEFKNASFISYYKENIFVGTYYTGLWKNSYVQRFPIDERGELDTTVETGSFGKGRVVYGKEKAKLSEFCQGVYFSESMISLMQSSGTEDSIVRWFVDSDYSKDVDNVISEENEYKEYTKVDRVIVNYGIRLDQQEKKLDSLVEEINKQELSSSNQKIVDSIMTAFNDEYEKIKEIRSLLTTSSDDKEKDLTKAKEELVKLESKLETATKKISDIKEEKKTDEKTTSEDKETSKEESKTDQTTDKDSKDEDTSNQTTNKDTTEQTTTEDSSSSNVEEVSIKDQLQSLLDLLEEYQSNITKYESAIGKVSDFSIEEYTEDTTETKSYSLTDDSAYASETLPPRLEQYMYSTDDLNTNYLLFESASYAYRAQTDCGVDRVIVLKYD